MEDPVIGVIVGSGGEQTPWTVTDQLGWELNDAVDAFIHLFTRRRQQQSLNQEIADQLSRFNIAALHTPPAPTTKLPSPPVAPPPGIIPEP